MIKIIQFFASILISLGIIAAPVAEYTPFENRAYSDTELSVEPDESKFIKVTAPDTGKDIYKLTEGVDFGYRYGPTLLYNADGSIDAFFAAPGRLDEWAVEQKLTNKIIAQGQRPTENGISSQSATVVKSDVSQLTKADRDEIRRRVARGEKISF